MEHDVQAATGWSLPSDGALQRGCALLTLAPLVVLIGSRAVGGADGASLVAGLMLSVAVLLLREQLGSRAVPAAIGAGAVVVAGLLSATNLEPGVRAAVDVAGGALAMVVLGLVALGLRVHLRERPAPLGATAAMFDAVVKGIGLALATGIVSGVAALIWVQPGLVIFVFGALSGLLVLAAWILMMIGCGRVWWHLRGVST